jgi:hypothetical protein
MQQAVQDRRDDNRIVEELLPVGKGFVGCDDRARLFVNAACIIPKVPFENSPPSGE